MRLSSLKSDNNSSNNNHLRSMEAMLIHMVSSSPMDSQHHSTQLIMHLQLICIMDNHRIAIGKHLSRRSPISILITSNN